MTETAAAAGDAVAASARGASFLILLQVGSRALTFGLNQLLLRFLSPELLGAAVQLEVFVITAHHFSRESLRIASQRHSHGGIQAPVNLSYLSILGGLVVVAGLGEWYLTAAHPDVPFFVPALRLCELAAVVELVSEPAFVVVQQKMLYKIRAAAEASAVVIKTLTTAAAIFWSQRSGNDLGVIPFAAGELAYCATLTLVYLWQTSAVARQDHFSLLLSRLKTRCVCGTDVKSYVFPFSDFRLARKMITTCPSSRSRSSIWVFPCMSSQASNMSLPKGTHSLVLALLPWKIRGSTRCLQIMAALLRVCSFDPLRTAREICSPRFAARRKTRQLRVKRIPRHLRRKRPRRTPSKLHRHYSLSSGST